jgi:hypothetical protein
MTMNATTLFQLLLACLLPAGAFATEFFVAPTGDDANPGTRKRPFASFQRAQQAVRGERKLHPSSGVTVTFKGGSYELKAPLEFTAADSGASTGKPVIYRADRAGTAVLSGGRSIKGWQRDPQRQGIWKTRVAEPKPGDDLSWRFEQLWVNGQRAVRARTPNYWEFFTPRGLAEELVSTPKSPARHTFSIRPDLLPALRQLSPVALKDAQIVVFHNWDTTREPIESLSPDATTLASTGGKMKSWNPMTRESLFYVENYLQALDSPGEWFLDREGWLYYCPRRGEDMNRSRVIAGVCDRFITIQGKIESPSEWVRHLRFEGLKFDYSEYRLPPEGLPPSQAAMNIDSVAVLVDGASDIRFSNCALEHLGSSAFWFRKACQSCLVERTRIFDLGIAAVRIGEDRIVPEPVRTGHITIDNCILQSGGRIVPSAVAVWIGHSSENAITHCDISDFFYTAISVGWRWGYAESGAKRNRIEYNHLHHLGYRILSDMGGVYTLGPSEGTTVRHNVIHDVYSSRYGGWGLYPDEGSTGILFENNLVYNVHDGCVHQHYGKANVFRNNILAFSELGQIALTRAEPHLSFTFERNLVYFDEGTLLGGSGWNNGAKVDLRNNLYWRAGSRRFDFSGKTWEQWQAAGRDQGSIIADPLFRNPAARDFRLLPGSPAEKVGFKPFDFTQAGVYGNKRWTELATLPAYPQPYQAPQPEPMRISDGFETGKNSPLLSLATLRQEEHTNLIAITTETAATGKHSLKVQDRPDLKAGYNPHFYWDPHYTKGRAHLKFRLRLEPGAQVGCEWRDSATPYRTGPSAIFVNRTLLTRGQKLCAVPENAWFLVEMAAPHGQADARWEIRITLPDGSCREFKELACDPSWKETRWMGFSSGATTSTSYQLDDLELENRQ